MGPDVRHCPNKSAYAPEACLAAAPPAAGFRLLNSSLPHCAPSPGFPEMLGDAIPVSVALVAQIILFQFGDTTA